MGRILFIRVSAETYDEKDVVKAWPLLYAAVWPDPSVEGIDNPAKVASRLEAVPGRGVLELLDGLGDYLRFGNVPDVWRQALEKPVARLENLRRELDDALGDRNVAQASSLTGAVEDVLDEAEQALREARK